MHTPAKLCLAAAALAALVAPSSAQIQAPPGFIDYQGQLLNSIGGPLTSVGGPGTTGSPENFEIRFRIWDAQTAGSLIWAEKQIVTIDGNGFFSVRLGEGEAITVADSDPNPLAGSESMLLDCFDANERFLGVTVMNPPDTPGEISPRLRFLSSPYAVAAEKARYAEFGPTGDAFTVDQLGIGTTAPNTALHVANTGSLNLLIEADTDDSGEADQPKVTFSQDGGINQFSVGFHDSDDSFSIENVSGNRQFTILPNGDAGFGTAGPLADVHLVRPNNEIATYYATGTSQGGGMFYAGQEHLNGGGFFYEGDSTPAHPGGNDRTVFFRRSNGSDAEVMSYAYNSNNVYFTGRIGVGTASPADSIHINSGGMRVNNGTVRVLDGNVHLDDGFLRLPAGQGSGVTWWYPSGFFPAAQIFQNSSNQLWVVPTSNGVWLDQSDTWWNSTSDERLKSKIDPLTSILDKIENIRVVGYNMASRKVDPETGEVTFDHNRPPRKTKSGKVIKHEIGTVAQDWLEHFPELVSEPKKEGDHYGLAYSRIGVVAIGAAQELNRKVLEQEAQIKARDAKIADLEARLGRLEALMSAAK